MIKVNSVRWVPVLVLAVALSVAYTNCSQFTGLTMPMTGQLSLQSFSASSNGPKLEDLFAGRAHFQPAIESEVVVIRDPFSNINPSHHASRFPTFFDAKTGKYFGFTRVLRPQPAKEEHYDVVLLRSDDGGRSFDVVSTITHATPSQDFLDPHLAIDTSVNPPNYVISMECGETSVSAFADACTMHSTTPTDPASWSIPKRFKIGCGARAEGTCSGREAISASTGLMLFDGAKKYFAWTSLELFNSNWILNTNRTYTSYSEITNVDGPAGYANQPAVMLDAEKDTHCKSAWDCNNRNLQDWVREGNLYYALYNGANYFGCWRPKGDNDSNAWGIAITRSDSPLGHYPPSAAPILRAQNTSLCGLSYGNFNRVQGDLYIYFAYFDSSGLSGIRRSKLVWNSGSAPAPTATPITPATPTPVPTATPALSAREAFMKEMFETVLSRSLGAAELTSARTMSCYDIAFMVAQSNEAYERRYKTFADAEFVRFVYSTIFGRAADDGGLGTWTNALGARTYTRETMITYFLNHAEFKARCSRLGIN